MRRSIHFILPLLLGGAGLGAAGARNTASAAPVLVALVLIAEGGGHFAPVFRQSIMRVERSSFAQIRDDTREPTRQDLRKSGVQGLLDSRFVETADGRPGGGGRGNGTTGANAEAGLHYKVYAIFVIQGLSPQVLLQNESTKLLLFQHAQRALEEEVMELMSPGNGDSKFRGFVVSLSFDGKTSPLSHDVDPQDVHMYIRVNVLEEHSAHHLLSWFEADNQELADKVLTKLNTFGVFPSGNKYTAAMHVHNMIVAPPAGILPAAAPAYHDKPAANHEAGLCLNIVIHNLTIDPSVECLTAAYTHAIHNGIHHVVGSQEHVLYQHKQDDGKIICHVVMVVPNEKDFTFFRDDLNLARFAMQDEIQQSLKTGIHACGDNSPRVDDIEVSVELVQEVKGDADVHRHPELDTTVVFRIENLTSDELSVLAGHTDLSSAFSEFLRKDVEEGSGAKPAQSRVFTHKEGEGLAVADFKMAAAGLPSFCTSSSSGNPAFSQASSYYGQAKALYSYVRANTTTITTNVERWLEASFNRSLNKTGNLNVTITHIKPPETPKAADLPVPVNVDAIMVLVVSGLGTFQRRRLVDDSDVKEHLTARLRQIVNAHSGVFAPSMEDSRVEFVERGPLVDTAFRMTFPRPVNANRVKEDIAAANAPIIKQVEAWFTEVFPRAKDVAVTLRDIVIEDPSHIQEVSLVLAINNISWVDVAGNTTILRQFDEAVKKGVDSLEDMHAIIEDPLVFNKDGGKSVGGWPCVFAKIAWHMFDRSAAERFAERLEMEEAPTCMAVVDAIKQAGTLNTAFFNLPLGHMSAQFHEAPSVTIVDMSQGNGAHGQGHVLGQGGRAKRGGRAGSGVRIGRGFWNGADQAAGFTSGHPELLEQAERVTDHIAEGDDGGEAEPAEMIAAYGSQASGTAAGRAAAEAQHAVLARKSMHVTSPEGESFQVEVNGPAQLEVKALEGSRPRRIASAALTFVILFGSLVAVSVAAWNQASQAYVAKTRRKGALRAAGAFAERFGASFGLRHKAKARGRGADESGASAVGGKAPSGDEAVHVARAAASVSGCSSDPGKSWVPYVTGVPAPASAGARIPGALRFGGYPPSFGDFDDLAAVDEALAATAITASGAGLTPRGVMFPGAEDY